MYDMASIVQRVNLRHGRGGGDGQFGAASREVEEVVRRGVARKRLVYIAECSSANNTSDFLRWAAERARADAMDGSGFSPDVVVLIKPRTLPNTEFGSYGVKKAFITGKQQTLYQHDWVGGGGGCAKVSTRPLMDPQVGPL
jgi:hypothetical protein